MLQKLPRRKRYASRFSTAHFRRQVLNGGVEADMGPVAFEQLHNMIAETAFITAIRSGRPARPLFDCLLTRACWRLLLPGRHDAPSIADDGGRRERSLL